MPHIYIHTHIHRYIHNHGKERLNVALVPDKDEADVELGVGLPQHLYMCIFIFHTWPTYVDSIYGLDICITYRYSVKYTDICSIHIEAVCMHHIWMQCHVSYMHISRAL